MKRLFFLGLLSISYSAVLLAHFPERYPSYEKILGLQDSLIKQRRFELRTLPSRNYSSYSVGSILIQESLSPSGSRVYNIPISTASGFALVPEISLVYNSQSGNDVAGYGWGIGGLSSITVRNANLYYDHQWYEVQANHLSAEYFKDIKMPNVRAKLEGSTKLSMTFSPDWYYYLSGSFLWANIYFQY